MESNDFEVRAQGSEERLKDWYALKIEFVTVSDESHRLWKPAQFSCQK